MLQFQPLQEHPKKERRDGEAADKLGTGKPTAAQVLSLAPSVGKHRVRMSSPPPPPHKPPCTITQPPAVSQPCAGTHAGRAAHTSFSQQQQQQLVAGSMVAGQGGGKKVTPATGQLLVNAPAAAAAAVVAAATDRKQQTVPGASGPNRQASASLEQKGIGQGAPTVSLQQRTASGHAERTHRGIKRRSSLVTLTCAPVSPAPQPGAQTTEVGDLKLPGVAVVPDIILRPTSSTSTLESKQEVGGRLSCIQLGCSRHTVFEACKQPTKNMCIKSIDVGYKQAATCLHM